MLQQLSVRNLALVEQASILFTPGLNVITGETGAGKSVLMGALSLLLGERAKKDAIRTGEDQCAVQAVFDLDAPEAINQILEDAGMPPCEEGQLMIRRVVKQNGSGQNLINDEPVTLNLLKRIGDRLVDMHGPYDHQSLLSPDTQLKILDAAGNTAEEREAYKQPYADRQALKQRRLELEGDQDSMEQQLDLLRYKVQELEEADLKADEEEALLEEHTTVGNAQNILEALGGATQAISEAEGNATDALAAVNRFIQSAQGLHPDAEAWAEEIDQIQNQTQELAASLNLAADRIEGDPGRLQWLDDRLAVYSRMKKKYGPSVEEALETLSTSKARLRDLENAEEELAKLEADEKAADAAVQKAGEALRKARQKAAKTLGEQIREQLLDLGFPHGQFEIGIDEAEPKATGIDAIDFRFAPNPGEPISSLKEIASSGEISRVMLAIKAILAAHDQVPVLVFDEIDANVGGEMGNAIGQKMSEVGKFRQVITITHLPQVAVFGEHHMAVRKTVDDGRSFTKVQSLDDEERIEEVSRMLGGKGLTASISEHARELIEQAQPTLGL